MANPLAIYADRPEDVGPFAAPGSTATLAEFLKAQDAAGVNDIEAEAKSQVALGEKFSAGVVAAYRQNRLANFTSSQDAAMAEAADHRIKTVQDQTGVQLENPFRDGYFREATERLDAAGGAGNLQDNRYAGIIAEQRRIFDEKMAEVINSFPDKAPALNFGQPIEDQAKAITQAAEYDGDHAEGGLLAAFVGSAAAAARDPLQLAALLASGGESAAGTALARIGWTALRQGLLNAGIAAVEQPSVQEWRADAGIRSGVVPSLENIGMNFVIGGVLGGTVHSGVELVRAEKEALIRVATGAGKPGDIETAARGLGVTIDADTAATIKTAEADLQHATVARDTAPEGLPEPAGVDLERQAFRHAEDPAREPPPALASPAAVAPDVPAAERVMAGFEARPIDGVAALRQSPELIEGALRSDLPDVVQSGRLASLSDEAWSMVAAGRTPPEHGIIAGELSPDPSFDAVILSRLSDARPENATEARLIAADTIEREASRRERAAAGQAEKPATSAPRSPRGRAAADPQTWSLFEALAREGGLKPDPELQAIFGTARGPLVRKNGRTLDDALRLAKDRGYMFDPADVSGAEGRVTLRDFLDHLDGESRGDRRYRLDHLPPEQNTAERDAHTILQRLYDEVAHSSGDANVSIDKAIENRVVQIMTREGEGDVLSAFERAIMEDAERYEGIASARQNHSELSKIDGWDIPFEGEPTPRDGGRDPSAGRTGQQPGAGGSRTDGATARDAGGGNGASGDQPVKSVAIEMPDGTRRDVMDLVPMLRDDGTVLLATPEAVAAMADHETGLANLVRACNL